MLVFLGKRLSAVSPCGRAHKGCWDLRDSSMHIHMSLQSASQLQTSLKALLGPVHSEILHLFTCPWGAR